MDRAQRRNNTQRKYISRIKKWFQFTNTDCSSWDEFRDKIKWTKLLRHNKLYGRSTMNNMEKHKTNKNIREESKQILKEAIQIWKVD